jgi:Tol biopolymer transport system component
MSPEQARGRAADQRSDVFSFGCVLYEMLTGRPPFQGEEISDVLASVLKSEPDVSLLPPKMNPRLGEVLRRCLEKNPKLRWHAIGDARVEIESILKDPRGLFVKYGKDSLARPLWKSAVPIILAVVLTIGITEMWHRYSRPEAPLAITRFPIVLGEGQTFTSLTRKFIAISPDGTQIVYEANRRLYRRLMSEVDAKPMSGTESSTFVVNPVFSPDGLAIAFYSSVDRSIKRIAVNGGTAVTICEAGNPYGLSWGKDGILFGEAKGIMRVSENGGMPELLVAVKPDEVAHGPQMLPDSETVLFTVAPVDGPAERWDKAKIVVQSIKSQDRRILINGGTDARYSPTGHIVYAVGGTLYAIPFDSRQLKVTGGPTPILEGVRRSTGASVSGAAQFSFSDTGSLIYVPGFGNLSEVLAFKDRKGIIEPLKLPGRLFTFPRVSRDGKRLAYGGPTSTGNGFNIYVYDLAGTTAPRQLTVGGSNEYPVWSPDGQRIAFQSDREGDRAIFWQPADGSSVAERLTKPEPGVAHFPDSWSPDGQNLSFTAVRDNERSVWTLSLKDHKAIVFAQAPSMLLGWSAFSPDGRWLAYQSLSETSKGQIWLQPFPNPTGAKYPIVEGYQPFWSSDGKELFCTTGPNRYLSISIKTTPSVTFGTPVPIPPGLITRNPSSSPGNADITPDGRFIGVISADQPTTLPQIQVVLNWFRELRERVPVK